jgi:hypothetical protein
LEPFKRVGTTKKTAGVSQPGAEDQGNQYDLSSPSGEIALLSSASERDKPAQTRAEKIFGIGRTYNSIVLLTLLYIRYFGYGKQ